MELVCFELRCRFLCIFYQRLRISISRSKIHTFNENFSSHEFILHDTFYFVIHNFVQIEFDDIDTYIDITDYRI